MRRFFNIADRLVGQDYPTYIIAEISCNHEGDFNEARRIIETAAAAGADAAKLQTYTADTISRNFQLKPKGTMWDNIDFYTLYKKAQTPWEWFAELKKVAHDCGIHLFSSPFDETAVDFLVDQGVPVLKVASFEIVDTKLLAKMADTGLPIIMSNGMTDFFEMREAFQILSSGKTKDVSILHCNSGYPAAFHECNLATIPVIAELFNCVVGLSDHTIFADEKNYLHPMTHVAPLEALKLGSRILEVHLTIDRNKGRELHQRSEGGFDWAFSRTPDEFTHMVSTIREYEKTGSFEYHSDIERDAVRRALGTVKFEPTEREIASRAIRPSLWVVEDIKAGELFRFAGGKHGNIDSIRPSGGLAIRFADYINGKKATCDISAGVPLSWEMVDTVISR